jgi:hypothetical protein
MYSQHCTGKPNEETYNAIRSTEMGRAYGPMHFEPGAFSKETSKSIVLSPYQGILPDGVASGFVFGNESADWQTGKTVLRVLSVENVSPKTHLDILHSNGNVLGLNAGAVIVDKTYVLEYLNFVSEDAMTRFESAMASAGDPLKAQSSIPIENLPIEKVKIGASEGVSVKFDSALDNPQSNLKVVLDEIKRNNVKQIRLPLEIPKSFRSSEAEKSSGANECLKVFRVK